MARSSAQSVRPRRPCGQTTIIWLLCASRSSPRCVRSRQSLAHTVPVRVWPPNKGNNTMYAPPGVKTSKEMPVPDTMRAWVLGGPDELKLAEKPVPVPKRAEVLVRIDAVAICATDLEIISHGPPAMIQAGLPFNKNWTPGHEYMGTVAALGPGLDEYKIGQPVTGE